MGRWEQTHETLRRSALELFAQRGYESVGTAQVAQAAGVSEMTLFRHFPTKEALLLSDPFDPLMADAVRERPTDESPMRALVEGIRQVWHEVDAETIDELRAVLRVAAQTPGLHGALERNSAETATALVSALVDRSVSEKRARVAVSAVIAGLSAALLGWAESADSSLTTVFSSALDVLGGE